MIEYKSSAITIWVDESLNIKIGWKEYVLMWYLITNSYIEELDFLRKLKVARKETNSWHTMHWCKITISDVRQIKLIREWMKIFNEDNNVYFHTFLYKVDRRYIPRWETYEHYFAKQSIFALANKMKDSWSLIQTMFREIKTINIIFDRRRDYEWWWWEVVNWLEEVYRSKITEQIKLITWKNITIRFSFVNSRCFDAIQFTDIFLSLFRNKILENDKFFTEIFDEFFINDLDDDVKILPLEQIFWEDSKLNYFIWK